MRFTQDGTLFSVTVEGNTTFYFVSDRAGVAAKCYFKNPSLVDGKMGLVRISGMVLEHDEENFSVRVKSIILVDEIEIRQPDHVWITHADIMARLA